MSDTQIRPHAAADAHAAATRDREAVALMTLDVAVRAAIHLIRQGRPGRAEWELVRAGMTAERILGRNPA